MSKYNTTIKLIILNNNYCIKDIRYIFNIKIYNKLKNENTFKKYFNIVYTGISKENIQNFSYNLDHLNYDYLLSISGSFHITDYKLTNGINRIECYPLKVEAHRIKKILFF